MTRRSHELRPIPARDLRAGMVCEDRQGNVLTVARITRPTRAAIRVAFDGVADAVTMRPDWPINAYVRRDA